MKKAWRRWAPYVYGLAALIVVAVSGYKLWEYVRLTQAQATGDRFIAALEQSAEGEHEQAIAALEAIAEDGSGGYPVLARLRIASNYAADGDTAAAIAQYDAIAADASAPAEIRNIAALRAGLLVVDQVDFSDLTRRIGDLAAVGNPWRHTAREILGLGAWRAGDYAAARDYFSEIANDQETPDDMRNRSQLMLTLIAADEPAPAPPASEG
jgi:hypothetical protein